MHLVELTIVRWLVLRLYTNRKTHAGDRMGDFRQEATIRSHVVSASRYVMFPKVPGG
jgi:hypothetical protein